MRLGRLSTHEDAKFLHAHKVIGAAVIAHFCWRWCCWAVNGSTGFDDCGSPWPLFWVLVHAALHVTSFQFALSQRRNRVYNIIWPEMRWHTTIFSVRGLAVIVFMWLSAQPQATAQLQAALRFMRVATVFITMIAADAVTFIYRDAGYGTTMRSNPYPDGAPRWAVSALNQFYSVSQAGATVVVMFSTLPSAVLFQLMPIQLAPFLMTLVKKGYMRQAGWHAWYAGALAANYVFLLSSPARTSALLWYETAGALLAFRAARIGMRVNKYVFWAAVVAYANRDAIAASFAAA